MERFLLAVLIPLLSIAIIAVFAGGLGVVFMLLEHAMHNEIGVMVLGMMFVVVVPILAYVAQRAVEK